VVAPDNVLSHDTRNRGAGAPKLTKAEDIEEGTVKYLNDTIGLVQCGYRVRILVRTPNETEARFFRLPEDGRVPVVSLIRTGYEDTTHHGPIPFRVTFTVLPADRHQFVINSDKVPEELAAPARDQ
jgi:DNA-binding GntR family transcriptional regulator